VDEHWWRVFDVVERRGELAGRRVLDVGCGTGRLEVALGERARVWGIDPSPEMLALARRQAPRAAGFKLARAEELPFKDGWFERAVMWLSVHLVDRPLAFRELYRVLAADGRLVIVSFDVGHFERYWLNAFFPSLERIDRARFPTAEMLSGELVAAGFEVPELVRLHDEASLTREEALERVRGRHISTFDLLAEDELRRGTERAERELPGRIDYSTEWLLAFARH
jgi:ubiquinone/menaquinone biosynthesis C-methylase UbiE